MFRFRVSSVLVASVAAFALHAQSIITIAGGRNENGRAATSVGFAAPVSVAADTVGNVYVSDRDQNRVGRIDAATGVFTVIAGTGSASFSGDGGPGTLASLDTPIGVDVDNAGNVFIADTNNNRVRRVDAVTGIITTVANLFAPIGVAVDAVGNLYITQSDENRVRRVDAATRVLTTIAGTGQLGSSGDGGPATAAQLNTPGGIVVASNGDVYFADSNNYIVRKISAATNVITTAAGSRAFGSTGDGGPATSAKISVPTDVALDSAGNLYIADFLGNRIRKVDAVTGTISLVAGTTAGFSGDGGPATSAQLSLPTGLSLDSAGNVYVADQHNSRVRRIDAATKTISTIGGLDIGDGGLATAASVVEPSGVGVDAAGNVYISDSGNHRIRKIAAGSGTISTLTSVSTNSLPSGLIVDPAGNIYFIDTTQYSVFRIAAGTTTATRYAGSGIPGFSGDGGPATSAMLSPASVTGIALDAAGNLYIADTFNDRIRRVDAVTKVITTLVSTSISSPQGVAVDAAGNVYIADTFNSRIRRVDATTKELTTIAGSNFGFGGDDGPAFLALLAGPTGLTFDAAGNLYIADSLNNRIRRIDLKTNVITTVAGNGALGFAGDGALATSARLNSPSAVAIDAKGTLYIADTNNNRIRMTTSIPLHRRPTRH